MMARAVVTVIGVDAHLSAFGVVVLAFVDGRARICRRQTTQPVS